MSKKVLAIISLYIILLSILRSNFIGISKSQKIQATTIGFPTNMPAIYIEPANLSASPGETFNVSVRIFNLTDSFWQTNTQWRRGDDLSPWSDYPLQNYSLGNLFGLDVQLGWDETVLKFVSNVTKIPVEDHPDGVLHQPIFKFRDNVSETHGFPFPQPEESRYWLACTTLGGPYGGEPFNGNGTVLELTFEVLKEGASNLTLTMTRLADADGNRIPHRFFSAFFRSPSSGPIYIRADGSIDPPSANIASADNITYYFTDNNYAGITVLRSNIVLDGNGYCIQGTNSSRGIDLSVHFPWLVKEIEDLPYGDWKTSAHFNEGEKLLVFFPGPLIDAMPSTIRVNITDPSGSNTTFRVDFWTDPQFHANITLELAGDGLLVGEPPLEGVMGSAGYDGDYIATVYTSNLTSAESCYPPNGVLPYLRLFGEAFGEDITIKNMTIKDFDYGVYLETPRNQIVGNRMINNNNAVYAGPSSLNNTIQGNNITANNDNGIDLSSSSSNSISGNNITANNGYGIRLGSSSNYNSIQRNNITNNRRGIGLYSSSNNSIQGNNITANSSSGIWIYTNSNYNSIQGNNIANNDYGILLFPVSKHNGIQGNNITNNGTGIDLSYSSNNSISGNNIGNNWDGIWLDSSSSNRVFHNNFVNNTIQLYSINSVNIWDDGYPSGGNYWSNYTGADLDYDGIGDVSHILDENNTDNYPLMGMFSCFNITSAYQMQTISNSTVSDPSYNGTAIFFYVTGGNSTNGFCRLTIPTALMNKPYQIFVNGTEVTPTLLPISNSTHSYIYFTYPHSTKEVVIIPEVSSFLILPLFMIATLLAGIFCRRRKKVKSTSPLVDLFPLVMEHILLRSGLRLRLCRIYL